MNACIDVSRQTGSATLKTIAVTVPTKVTFVRRKPALTFNSPVHDQDIVYHNRGYATVTMIASINKTRWTVRL